MLLPLSIPDGTLERSRRTDVTRLKGFSRVGHTTNVLAGVDTVYPGQLRKKWKTGGLQASSVHLAKPVKSPIDDLISHVPPAWRVTDCVGLLVPRDSRHDCPIELWRRANYDTAIQA